MGCGCKERRAERAALREKKIQEKIAQREEAAKQESLTASAQK